MTLTHRVRIPVLCIYRYGSWRAIKQFLKLIKEWYIPLLSGHLPLLSVGTRIESITIFIVPREAPVGTCPARVGEVHAVCCCLGASYHLMGVPEPPMALPYHVAQAEATSSHLPPPFSFAWIITYTGISLSGRGVGRGVGGLQRRIQQPP